MRHRAILAALVTFAVALVTVGVDVVDVVEVRAQSSGKTNAAPVTATLPTQTPNAPRAAVSSTDGVIRLYPLPFDRVQARIGGPAALLANPTKALLYAAPEWGSRNGRLLTFGYSGTRLVLRQTKRLKAAGSVQLAISSDLRTLVIAHYTSGSVSIVKLDGEGLAGTATTVALQPRAKAHAVVFVGEQLVVTDLENDRLEFIDIARGPRVAASLLTASGDGPRSIAVIDDNTFVISNELGDSMACYRREGDSWRERGRISLTIPGRAPGKPADVMRIDDVDGLPVVVLAERNYDELVTATVAPDCAMVLRQRVASGGVSPRSLIRLPDGVAIGHEKGNISTHTFSSPNGLGGSTSSLATVRIQSIASLPQVKG